MGVTLKDSHHQLSSKKCQSMLWFTPSAIESKISVIVLTWSLKSGLSIILIFPLELGLIGILVKALLDLGSGRYLSFQNPLVLLWLFLAFKLPSGIPKT